MPDEMKQAQGSGGSTAEAAAAGAKPPPTQVVPLLANGVGSKVRRSAWVIRPDAVKS
jgi:hypothetical protein